MAGLLPQSTAPSSPSPARQEFERWQEALAKKKEEWAKASAAAEEGRDEILAEVRSLQIDTPWLALSTVTAPRDPFHAHHPHPNWTQCMLCTLGSTAKCRNSESSCGSGQRNKPSGNGVATRAADDGERASESC